VIQEHHARRLHYDLRLEHDGVFVSWAVPKGVPETADHNHLAVMTEDHPLSYGTFEGEIPKGEYGAGTVTIWDTGTYELEKWREGEVIFTLVGRPDGPLDRARLALIRTDGRGEKSSWLLHRMKTDGDAVPHHAASVTSPGASEDEGAATTGHGDDAASDDDAEVDAAPGIDDVVADADADVDADAREPGDVAADGDAPDVDAQDDESRNDGPTGDEGSASAAEPLPDGSGASTNAPWPDSLSPARLRPMLAENASATLARSTARRWSAQWAEIKWDGIRALAFWDGTRMLMRARSGTDITERYPEVTGAAAAVLGPHPMVLDGEVVAFDAAGRPSFTRLQNRMHLTKAAEIRSLARSTPVRFHVFDLLALDGQDLTARPLRERRELLDGLLADAPAVLSAPPVFDDVDAALESSAAFALEGVVVKNPGSRYRAGDRSGDWLKVKHVRTQEVVIGGVRPGQGGRNGSIGSLLMGIPTEDGLHYVGRVGSGFGDRMLRLLDEQLGARRTGTTPFVDVPAADTSDAWWVRPELVGEVAYAEVTPDGRLRHARWRGLRPDKSPADVRDES
jgi:bifunctional non-homologous end joining protein LigD